MSHLLKSFMLEILITCPCCQSVYEVPFKENYLTDGVYRVVAKSLDTKTILWRTPSAGAHFALCGCHKTRISNFSAILQPP